MWLNLIILSFACLFVGFILGWIAACPRRWQAYLGDERLGHNAHDDRPERLPQVTTGS
jgi:hypothetical protein